MLYLKKAEKEDLEDFLSLTEELFNTSVYSTIHPFDKEYISKKFLDSLEESMDKICTVLLKEDGKTIGVITMATASLFSEKEKLATELAFYTKDKRKAGYKKLLEAYYYWAKQVGCTHVLVGKIKDHKTPEMFYTRRLK